MSRLIIKCLGWGKTGNKGSRIINQNYRLEDALWNFNEFIRSRNNNFKKVFQGCVYFITYHHKYKAYKTLNIIKSL